MLALTLHPWWAHAIASGPKRVENRSWLPRGIRAGDRLAIHAGSRRPSRADLDLVHTVCAAAGVPRLAEAMLNAPGGRVVAEATLLGVDDDVLTPWDADGWHHWRLGDVAPCDGPVIGGQLGIWRLP